MVVTPRVNSSCCEEEPARPSRTKKGLATNGKSRHAIGFGTRKENGMGRDGVADRKGTQVAT